MIRLQPVQTYSDSDIVADENLDPIRIDLRTVGLNRELDIGNVGENFTSTGTKTIETPSP
jgi:hypothetical protein